MSHERESLVHEFHTSYADGSFIKLSLGKPRHRQGIQKIVFSPVKLQERLQLKVVQSFPTQDKTQILSAEEAAVLIREMLGVELRSGNLFTIAGDLAVMSNRRGELRLHRSKPSLSAPSSTSHNRKKNYRVELERPFLYALGLSDSEGRIKPSMAHKFKQTQRFVELLDGLIDEAGLTSKNDFTIVDIGSGKGYLTFALYDFLVNGRSKVVDAIGVECRHDLVEFCNVTAQEVGFERLRFQAEIAASTTVHSMDILIALHACDTATDDALHLGVSREASLIVCAPCCQHELAPQLTSMSQGLTGIQRFGLFKQRQADIVTDAARALLLEAAGYRVKVIEFVSTEHTNKNIMLAAVRSPNVDCKLAWQEYSDIKKLFGFEAHSLERLLHEPLGRFRTESQS